MIIANPPGRTFVQYRVGDFRTFRQALLRARLEEKALADWQPSAQGDLAVQMLEWWAYLADVLTFYNEQAIQEMLLRTAVAPQDVRRIIRLLGYRPRPGIGATGVVAAMTDSARPFVLPRGFAIEGLSAPGQPAQVFELDDDVEIGTLGQPLPFLARIPSIDRTLAKSLRSRRKIPAPLDMITGLFLNFLPAGPPPPKDDDPAKKDEPFTVALDRVVLTIEPGDTILFLKRGWRGHIDDPTGFAMATVSEVEPAWDATGHAITRMTSVLAHSLSMPHKDYRVLRSTKRAHLWLYHKRYPGSANLSLANISGVLQVVQTIFDPLHLFTSGPSSQPPEDPRVLAGLSVPVPPFPERRPQGAAHLEAITRGINPGDPVLFDKRVGGAPGGPFRAQLVKVTGYSEEIWYANPPEIDRIGQGPPIGPPGSKGALAGLVGGGSAAAPIPIPHSKITFDVNPFLDGMSMDGVDIDKIVVHYGWEEVGEQVDAPSAGPTKAVVVPAIPGVPPLPVLIKDATGKGKIAAIGQLGTDDGEDLVPPLEALLHLLPISRGRTVEREVLGSGDSILIRQEFVLKRSPLTYLADTDPASAGAYRSTLRIRVDGIEWHEVPSFYDVAASARVFVTREDDEQKTHVRFGDGENGARLPTGTDNVVARYRYGSGAAVPPVGTLKSILKPQRGIQRIENPVPPGGGADPDSREQVRRYAPQSVLTFGRAVSGDDYETLAAQTPGVQRARAYWSWDGASQRTLVKVFVGDDAAAVAAATTALRAFADPNRPVLVALAAPMYADVSFTLEVDPAYEPESVRTAVSAALLDPRNEIFGTEVVRIGRTVYDSHIHEACLRIDGVRAVRALRFGIGTQELRPIALSPGTGAQPPEVADSAARSIALETLRFLDPGAVALPRDWQPDDRVDPPVEPRFTLEDVVRLESGVRHSPGEGSFYLLRGDRLHITAEVARHGE